MTDQPHSNWTSLNQSLQTAGKKFKGKEPRPVPTVSTVLEDGSLVEMLYRPEEHRTVFCVFKDGTWREENTIVAGGQRLVPYSPNNNLLKNNVVLLPSTPREFGSEDELLAEIQSYLHRYLDVSPLFEKIAAYYVLLSWVYDAFNELPYLRARGDYGSGKTRFLLVIGSICYKPIFASGASTVSPIFRILDVFRGTLILDEGDFHASDEKAEIVKILNNGNAKGFPVLRSEVLRSGEFDPRAYHVYGPKIVASRGFFEDRALESRFLSESMGQHRMRKDVPINLPDDQKAEALELRNKLLLFRFRARPHQRIVPNLIDESIEPRFNQVFTPLLSIIQNAQTREELLEMARRYDRESLTDRSQDVEAQVLTIIHDMLHSGEQRLPLQAIASWFVDRYGDDYERKVTPRWIGWVIRRRLDLTTHKSDGVFVIPLSEEPKLKRLWERYGIGTEEPQLIETSAETNNNSHPVPGTGGTSGIQNP